MDEPIRYLFDQHQRNSVAHALRRQGADAVTAHEVNRCGKPDPDLLRLAAAEGRVIVTFDSDFLVLAADFLTRGEDFAGVIYCEPAKFMLYHRKQIRSLKDLHGRMSAADMRNHVEYL